MKESILKLLQSDDYKIRLLGEYYELKERYDKLHKMVIKYEAGTLDFTPSCPLGLLERQANLMEKYLNVLDIRLEIERIQINSTDGIEVSK